MATVAEAQKSMRDLATTMWSAIESMKTTAWASYGQRCLVRAQWECAVDAKVTAAWEALASFKLDTVQRLADGLDWMGHEDIEDAARSLPVLVRAGKKAPPAAWLAGR